MSLQNWGLLCLLSLLWGGSFFLAEIALSEASSILTVWSRVSIAAVFLILIVFLKGELFPKDRKLWGAFFILGLLNNALPFSLIVWGQTALSGSVAAIFNATTPLFTLIIAHVFTWDEKLSFLKIGGLTCGFIGVVIMLGEEALDGLNRDVLAMGAILIAALSYGSAALYGKRFKDQSPLVTSMGQVVCSSLLMTPLVVIWGFPGGFFIPSLNVISALLALALLSTVLAYILYFKILKTTGASNLMLVTFLVPLSALLLGSLFLGERLEFHQVIGMCLILSGLALIDGRLFRKD